MKEKTKDMVTVGGLAVAALGVYYFMAPGDVGAVGGFGGGGIPLLPGDTEGAAEEDLTTIIYNLPTPPMESPFAPAPEAFVKKTATVPAEDIATAVSGLKPSTKLYGGFTLPELQAAPMEFFESDVFAQQTGLMTRARTSEVVQDMLKESQKRGYITQAVTKKHHEAASIRFDPSKYKPSAKREWTGGLRSTTKGAGVHFTTSGTGTLRKRPKKSSTAPGSPD